VTAAAGGVRDARAEPGGAARPGGAGVRV